METKTSIKRHIAIKAKKFIKLNSTILIKNEYDKSLK